METQTRGEAEREEAAPASVSPWFLAHFPQCSPVLLTPGQGGQAGRMSEVTGTACAQPCLPHFPRALCSLLWPSSVPWEAQEAASLGVPS